MARSSLTAGQIADALERRKHDEPLADIADALGVSRRTLGRVLAEHAPAKEPINLRPAVVEPDDSDDQDDQNPDELNPDELDELGVSGLDLESQRARLVKVIRDEQTLIQALLDRGEVVEARKSKDLMLRAENSLSRLNRSLPEGAHIVTAAELRAAEASALQVLDTIAEARPNLCAHCSTKLALTWGESVRKRGGQ